MKQWTITKEFCNEIRTTIIELNPAKMVASGNGKRVWVEDVLEIKMVLIARYNNNINIEVFPLFHGCKKDGRNFWHLLKECGYIEDESQI